MSGEHAIRKRKRDLIEEFFQAHLGERVSSCWLHMKFGTAARTRISEINRDEKCAIIIKNQTRAVEVTGVYICDHPFETSVYWSELRPRPLGQASLFEERRT